MYSQWVSVASGANYPAFAHLGPVLDEVSFISVIWPIVDLQELPMFEWSNFKVVKNHLQFQPEVRDVAEKIVFSVAASGKSNLFYVGIHVRWVPWKW